MFRDCLLSVIGFMILTGLICTSAFADAGTDRRRLVEILQKEMATQTGWVRVHAAEALVHHGYGAGVAAAFAPEADTAAAPLRIGVWRVLATASPDETVRTAFVGRIRAAFLNPDGPDRLHAAEALAKLGVCRKEDRPALEAYLAEQGQALGAFACWVMALSGDVADVDRLAGLLESTDPVARLRAGVALGRLAGGVENLSLRSSTVGATRESPLPSMKERLSIAAGKEPADSPAAVYLACAAYRAGGEASHRDRVLYYLQNGKTSERYEAALALGARGDEADLPLLTPLLDHAEADVRIGAADASLRILRRTPHRIGGLDWAVIGLYLVTMLGIGVYYSRQSVTRDDYLLGGRTMKPWAVGLSYFATIFSTITYMSWPGEVIRHGPMMVAQILGFPLAIFAVGWFIIPFLLRLRVTSAYEILETRLGLGVRMLGSVFFLAMRVFWMAVIIHATTHEVLVPVAGLPESSAPWLATALGVITVVYTSMGGFKAVVFTDVAQTAILFGGALLSVGAVTVAFGGFSWWPSGWDPGWERPVWVYAPGARVTLLNAIVSLVVWHVCTAGSDQMAVQRCLAVRDARAARRMFMTGLTANGVVFVFLAVLGLALAAFFRARPEMMQEGQSFAANADRLFPQFIVFGLPPGLTGLVTAGLLAAAMSSLSSGVSSAGAVITVDFIERFRRGPLDSARGGAAATGGDASTARMISWVIGAVVVLLSTGMGSVQGNLLEVTYKVVNLLTAPLFGLFFMAMFVRRATPFGTFVGAAAGVAVIVLVNFWKEIVGSEPVIGFMWGMPLALAAQVSAGMLASLLPVGPPAAPLEAIRPIGDVRVSGRGQELGVRL